MWPPQGLFSKEWGLLGYWPLGNIEPWHSLLCHLCVPHHAVVLHTRPGGTLRSEAPQVSGDSTAGTSVWPDAM